MRAKGLQLVCLTSVYLECGRWCSGCGSDAGHGAMPAKPTSQLQLAVLPVLGGVASFGAASPPCPMCAAWNHRVMYIVVHM